MALPRGPRVRSPGTGEPAWPGGGVWVGCPRGVGLALAGTIACFHLVRLVRPRVCRLAGTGAAACARHEIGTVRRARNRYWVLTQHRVPHPTSGLFDITGHWWDATVFSPHKVNYAGLTTQGWLHNGVLPCPDLLGATYALASQSRSALHYSPLRDRSRAPL